MRALTLLLSSAVIASSVHGADAVVKLVIGSASAKPKTVLATGSTFSTGSKSHSELTLANGVVRSGSGTDLRITGPDAVALDKGLAVVASAPRALFRKSLTVTAPKHHLKVRGTAQIYHDPGHSIRVVVLEGQVTIALESLSHESVTLRPGQELIINPVDKRLPQPIEVDLNRLIATAQLLSSRFDPLPTTHVIADIGHQQVDEVGNDDLEATGLVMADASGEVFMEPMELVHDEVGDEIGDLDGNGEPDPDPLAEDGDTTDTTAADGTDAAATDQPADEGDSGDAQAARKKGVRGKAKAAGKTKPARNRAVVLNNAAISSNEVTIGNSRTRASVQITNSSQIAALAGQLQVLANGGSIAIDSSTLSASGALILDTSGNAPGVITLNNVTLSADTIRARAFGSGGASLIIDGSTLNASQLIELYAEGASDVVFRNHVVLNTPLAKIAGKGVQVDASGRVDVSGHADVYTDDARFNRAGYGSLNANGGVSVHSQGSH